MEPLIVWADASRVDRGASHAFTLDMQYGVESPNDFALTLPSEFRLGAGYYVYVEDTGYGGVVDGCSVDTSVEGAITWTGRTWQGMLDHKVVRPDSGASHYTASGTIRDCISALLSRIGLAGVFAVGECLEESISYQYARYCTAWEGLLAMLASAGLRPTFEASSNHGRLTVLVGAVSRTALQDAVDSDLLDFAASAAYRPTNHLVCLGSGELASRLVVDIYTDANGNISQTQTLFGPDEVAEVYESSATSSSSELLADGTKTLEDLQDVGEVTASVSESLEADVGDVVRAYDARMDLSASASIANVVVQVADGAIHVTRESGKPTTKLGKR